MATAKPPEKPVVLGRVSAPHGVAGWIRIEPYTESTAGLLAHRAWWVGDGTAWKRYPVLGSQASGRRVVAKLEGCDDRDSAARLRGMDVAVARDELPRTATNEWYWTDLIGLTVVNVAGDELGRLSQILRTGANDVLVVRGERERLIPFVEDVVRAVDLHAGVIRVAWSADY